MESWRKIKVLVKGPNGYVFLACPVGKNDQLAAVKSVYGRDRVAVTRLKMEANFLTQLIGKPNIIQCFGEDMSIEKGHMVYNLLLEYTPGGTLHQLIQNTNNDDPMHEVKVACYARMLLEGLSAMHSQKIVHCDLKPENILVTREGGTLQLKIANFTRARRDLEEEEFMIWDAECHNRGTMCYASPESVAFGQHDASADIWSFGIVVIEMMTGEIGWSSNEHVRKKLLNGTLKLEEIVPSHFSRDAMSFLGMCLQIFPFDRSSALELLRHPFIVRNSRNVPLQSAGIVKNPFSQESSWVSRTHIFTQGRQMTAA